MSDDADEGSEEDRGDQNGAESEEPAADEAESAEETPSEDDVDAEADETGGAESGGADEGGDETAEEGADADADDADDDGEVTVERLSDRLDAVESELEAAETEADLDAVESTLDAVESDVESLVDGEDEGDEEDEEDEDVAALRDRVGTLRESVTEARGPYAEDVVESVVEAGETVEETRWTADGLTTITPAVGAFARSAGETLDESFEVDGEEPEALAASLARVADGIEAADLDPDADAETIETLVEVVDDLVATLDDAESWDDLDTREKLVEEGYYDVLGHYKDFPPEWAALKEHERRGNVEMVLLALDQLQSEFMERHCLEALGRMNDEAAFEAMHERASKRDRPGIRVLGKVAATEAVDTLLEYVDEDSDPQLQKVTFRALGEIGDERAVQPLANKLAMENDEVRPLAARALGMIGDTRAVAPLATTLAEDESDTVRAAAAWALRQIGTEAALEAAADHADDRSYLVQHEAERAAEALGADAPTA